MENSSPRPWYRRIKINALQKYVIIFFIVAVALLLLSWFFQSRISSNAMKYEGIIADRDISLTSAASRYDQLSRDYSSATQKIAELEKAREAQDLRLSALEIQVTQLIESGNAAGQRLSAQENLIAAQLLYSQKKRSEAREILAQIEREALSPQSAALYDSLTLALD